MAHHFSPSPPRIGSLRIIIGPMTSGKTTRLLSLLNSYSQAGYSTCYLSPEVSQRPASDCLYTLGSATTHNSLLRPEQPCPQQVVSQTTQVDSHYDVLGFDEYQFFSPDFNDFILSLVNQQQKIVICCGLQSDFRGEKFGPLIDLLPQCDDLEHLKAVCPFCHYSAQNNLHGAVFTRLRPKEQKNSSVLLLGDSQRYQATCRYHFNTLPTV